MKRRDLLMVFLSSLIVRLAVAVLVLRPGYMDAAYYAAGAVRIARGGGFSEPFIWNYLNDPAGLPHPGFLYWMPLPSLLAAPFATMFPNSFFALQVPFAVLSALIPVVTYGLAWQVTGRRRLAWAAGLLTVFSGFFFPYWTLPETFAPFALFGSLALWQAGRQGAEAESVKTGAPRQFLAGVLAGLAHLTRADGVLLLPIVALAPLVSRSPRSAPGREAPASSFALRVSRPAIGRVLLVVLGYLLVLTPWFARNVAVIGTPLSPAGTKTIWLTNYDDLFCYDCDPSLSSYLAWGWDNILRSKLSALWVNFQRLLAEGGLVFLLPFAFVGFYRLRGHLTFLLGLLYLVAIYLAHSLVFTFPGWRGGFFHASSALLPFFHAAAMAGLDATVLWVARRRRSWRYGQAQRVFILAVVVGGVILSGYMAGAKIPEWRKADTLYEAADRWMTDQGTADAGLMVGNPPALWYHTDRAAIVIPNGDVETLLKAADRYRIQYVLLQSDHPAALANLHAGDVDHPRLSVVKVWPEEEAVLYIVAP